MHDDLKLILVYGNDIRLGKEKVLKDTSGSRQVDVLSDEKPGHRRFRTIGNHADGIHEALSVWSEFMELFSIEESTAR